MGAEGLEKRSRFAGAYTGAQYRHFFGNLVELTDAAVFDHFGVMLQGFLLGRNDLTDWQAGDLIEDGEIDVFDMVSMRKLIISGK